MIASGLVGSALVVTDDTNPDQLKTTIDNALPIAGLFVVILGVVMYFLWKSMSRQFGKIDPQLPDGPDDRERAKDRQLTEEAIERGKADARGRADASDGAVDGAVDGSADDAAGT